MAGFLSRLILAAGDGEGAKWTVQSPFMYSADCIDRIIIVPEGFKTDLASVPRVPIIYLLAAGYGNEASVIHDYLYSVQLCSRKDADAVFYEAALVSDMPRWRAALMHAGIRIGGGAHWKSRNEY